MQKMKELITELNNASMLYYNGEESPLTDREYDLKLDELKSLEKEAGFVYSNSPTINVGAAPILKGIDTIEIIDKPMLSLDKVHTADEIVKFSDGYDLIASIKCDGLSVRIIYEDGKLISANTRGNGIVGSDITNHIKHFLNVPNNINKEGIYIIDGEAIIYDDDFKKININNEFKNNRNTASGSLTLLDMSIVESRRLSFIAWDIIKGGKAEFYHYNLEEAADLGFTVIPALALDCTKVEEVEINEINKILFQEAREKGIPCDGVVWKINDIKAGELRGRTSHHWCNAIAWKPEKEEYPTTLIDIDYDISRNGILTPVAIFTPVEIDGSTVSRASLHNLSIMENTLGNSPKKGQVVYVYKSNMIIPQISHSDNMESGENIKNAIPSICPVCGKELEISTSDSGVKVLKCVNELCTCRIINKIDHFVSKKALDIKGLSRATLEKFESAGFISTLEDIFTLKDKEKNLINLPGFGVKSVGKLLDAIETGKNTTLDRVLCGIGIPLIGVTAATTISKRFNGSYDEFKKFVNNSETTFEDIEGFGYEMNYSLKHFNYDELDTIVNKYLKLDIIDNKNNEDNGDSVKGINFVITGKLSQSRDKIKSLIEKNGGKVTGSVSSKTNYLICNTPEDTTKYKTAMNLNIPIINEEKLFEMLKNF